MAVAQTDGHPLSSGTSFMVHSNDWWCIHMSEGKLRCRSNAWRPPRTCCTGWQSRPIVCPTDILHIPRQAVFSTQNANSMHKRTVLQLLVVARGQLWLREGRVYIYYLSLIFQLLSVANYLYPDIRNGNHMAGQNAWALMYAFSHTGFPKQTPHLNMTCEPGVYFLPWLCVCDCAEWCYPAPMSTAGFIARLTC